MFVFVDRVSMKYKNLKTFEYGKCSLLSRMNNFGTPGANGLPPAPSRGASKCKKETKKGKRNEKKCLKQPKVPVLGKKPWYLEV